MGKMKILCLSIWYPLAIARYWENAMKRNPNIDLITVGSYTGNWIPWGGTGMSLLDKYARPPTYPLPFKPNVGKVSYDFVRAQIPEQWKPDLVLTIDAGINWTHKPFEGIVATVGTDGHCLDYSHARSISDYFFNMHPVYSMSNDNLLSYAFDPGVHYAMSDVEKDTDAVLIGMPYEQRVQWVKRLRAAGVSVLFENGPVFDEYRELNNRARIGLNWSSMDDTNARCYELCAMRLCLVTNRTPDLKRAGFEEDRHYLGFSSLDEAVSKVLYAKNNPEIRDMIANNGYQFVTQNNMTYDNLIQTILKEIGLQ